jgi:response regulator RpfG family c-di-GMP phosphodiesterase
MIDRKPLIVVVHEHPQALYRILTLLASSGYEVVGFRSLDESRGFIRENRPELVLAKNIGVGEADRVEFLEVLKSLSFSTEGVFLPPSLEWEEGGAAIQSAQDQGILRIVERLIHTVPLEIVLTQAAFS